MYPSASVGPTTSALKVPCVPESLTVCGSLWLPWIAAQAVHRVSNPHHRLHMAAVGMLLHVTDVPDLVSLVCVPADVCG